MEKALLKNLSIDEKDVANLKKVPINRHHWSLQQLHYFFDQASKKRSSTPMKCCDLTKIAHSVERNIFVKKNGVSYFFNVPNHPIDLVRKDAAAIEDEKKVEKRREKVIKEIDDRRNDVLAEKQGICENFDEL